ncbi:MAG: head GIN domain-containing protein [Anaerolineales bacterium]
MKTKKLVLVLVVAALMLSTMACGFNVYLPRTVKGNGNVVEESRSIESFSRLDFQGIGNIYVSYGEKQSLTIEAEENLIPYLETFTRGDTLVIKVEDGRNINPTAPVDFYVTVTDLESVDVSGLGNVELPEIEADRFTIEISGAGDIEIDALVADSFKAEMTGLGNLDIDGGEVVSQEVRISGSGKYNARRMDSQDANIEISGLGSATVSVSEYLDVSISGAGDVEYYGSPEIDKSISGLGKLEQMDD